MRWFPRPGRVTSLVALMGSIALLAAGCGDEPSSFGIAHEESKVDHPRATDEEFAAGAEIVNHVATELYGPIAEAAGDGNVAYSPLSIATALAMARAGADGDSADQLDQFFAAADPSTLGRSVNGAGAGIESLTGPVQLDSDEMAEIDMSNANALWGQSGVEWSTPFLDALRADFDASMWTADYERDPDRARYEVNDWVAEHTREHITQLLPSGSIDELTRLVLTNAVYFSAPWPDELFESKQTTPFTTASGETVEPQMLVTTEQMAFQQGDGWQAASLPYAGRKLAMTFLVPDEGKLGDVEAALDDDLLHQVLTGGEMANVTLSIPAFDIDQRSPVADVLKGLRVTAPFETTTDFEPMSSDPEADGLHIDDVLHQATVTVDKNGTVATAATAVTMSATGMPMVDHELTADRPFLFVIHDVEHGTPVFVGRIADPTVK